MFFKRQVQRYSHTPELETPYKAGVQEWDRRIGSAIVQAANWRLMAFGSLALSCLLAAGVIWESTRNHVVPYVVEVDKLGGVQSVGPAIQKYNPTDAEIAKFLSDYIRDVRALSIDPVVVVGNWNAAWNASTDHAKAFLGAYARQNDPSKVVSRRAVEVDVINVVRASDTSFEVKWTERITEQDAPTRVEHWTAILSYVISPPNDQATINNNPLGIYVNGINWSREYAPNEQGG